MEKCKLLKLRLLLMALIIAAAMIPMAVSAYDGSGDQNNPFLVENAEDLQDAINNGGYVKLNGDITLESTLRVASATPAVLDLNGKTLTAANDAKKRIHIEKNSDLTIINGKIISNTTSEVAGGAVMIRSWGDLTIGAGAVITSKPNVIWPNDGTLTVEDGATIISEEKFAITTNGTAPPSLLYSGDAVVNIKGGNIKSGKGTAVYAPAGTFNVSGGTIEGASGIYVKSGLINVTGGTIAANGEKKPVQENNSGANATGDAIVVESASNAYQGTPVLVISGSPVIRSENAATIHQHIRAGDVASTIESNTSALSLSDGSAWVKENDKYVVKSGEAAIVSGETTSVYASLQEALNAAKSGETVKMLKDVTLDKTITVATATTAVLDLNGKTLTAANDASKRIELQIKADLTIINGKIESSTTHDPTSGLPLTSSVMIRSWGNLTIGAGAEIKSDPGAIWANDGKLTVKEGALVVSKYASAISTNGSGPTHANYSGNAVIKIEGGVIKSTNGIAVYAPAGTFNVSGGTIEGATGIYAKSGLVNITGGTITANGERKGVQEYNNGAYPTGDAIVVESAANVYQGTPVLKISGSPVITSENAATIQQYIRENNVAPTIESTTNALKLSDGLIWVKKADKYYVENAIDGVRNMIEALDPASDSFSDDVEAARKAFDGLDDTQKQALGQNLEKLLVASEAVLSASNASKAAAELTEAKADLAMNVLTSIQSVKDASEYKKASYTAYNTALEAATSALNKSGATVTDYRTANSNLSNAVKGLLLKDANTLTVKAKTAKLKAKKLKKANQKLAVSKVVRITDQGQGSITYAKMSGNKKITVAKTGKVTVKKGLKKGTYKVKVNVTAAGNDNTVAATKTVTFKVRVR